MTHNLQPSPRQSAPIPVPIILGLILVGGLAFAAYRIGAPSLWLDESYTWLFSQMEMGEMLEAARVDGVNPPLYYVAAWMTVRLLGGSETGLRALSAVAHAAAILGVYLAGRKLGAASAGLAAAGVWALHPMALWYARDARPYAMAAALGAFLVWLFLRCRERVDRRSLLAAGCIMAAGLITHYFFFALVACLLLLAVLEIHNQRLFFRYWALVTLVSLAPLTLWLLWFFALPEPSLGIGWIDPPTLADLPATIWNLLSGYGGAWALATAAFGLTVGALLIAALSRRPGQPGLRRLFVAAVLIPLLAVWLLSQRRPVYVDRYFLVLLPIVAALAGSGAASISEWAGTRPRPARWAPILLVLVGTLSGLAAVCLVHRDLTYAKEDWRQLSQTLTPAGSVAAPIWRSEPEILLPLSFYLGPDPRLLDSPTAADCRLGCWYVARKPYTATHAFGQSVQEAERPWQAVAPDGCQELDAWRSETGVAALWIVCEPAGG